MAEPTSEPLNKYKDDTVEELLPGVIKSVDEYVDYPWEVTELTETKFQPPEVSDFRG